MRKNVEYYLINLEDEPTITTVMLNFDKMAELLGEEYTTEVINEFKDRQAYFQFREGCGSLVSKAMSLEKNNLLDITIINHEIR